MVTAVSQSNEQWMPRFFTRTCSHLDERSEMAYARTLSVYYLDKCRTIKPDAGKPRIIRAKAFAYG